MDILSREMLDLLRDEGLRRALDELLDNPEKPSTQVTVTGNRQSSDRRGSPTSIRRVTLRRLAV
ncbi:MAG: hypothetical protein QM736_15100 [Vicinamibacterales bacterium]